MAFDECSDKARGIKRAFGVFLDEVEEDFEVSFKDMEHNMSLRFLNEIEEFELLDE